MGGANDLAVSRETVVVVLKRAVTVIGWRAWYDRGTGPFDSTNHKWEDIPDDGIQVLVLYRSDGGRRMISGCDYYFKAGNVYGSNNDSLEVLEQRYPGVVAKRGRWASEEEIDFAQKAADAVTEAP